MFDDDRMENLEDDLRAAGVTHTAWSSLAKQFAVFYYTLIEEADIPEDHALEMTKSAISSTLATAGVQAQAQSQARLIASNMEKEPEE